MNNHKEYQHDNENNKKNQMNSFTKPGFPGYIIDKKININLFDDYVIKTVNFWFSDNDNKKRPSSNQIRNIYNEVKNIEKIINKNEIEARIRLKMLKAKIKYNEYRDNNKLNKYFGETIIEWINNINENNFKEEFYVFSKLFESAVGYSYQKSKK